MAGAADPYVLRFQGKDRRRRIQLHDLVLISQSQATEANIYVVKAADNKLSLARRLGESEWEAEAQGKRLTAPVTPVGYCLGIVWGPL